jgi:sialate O-acetylesterase
MRLLQCLRVGWVAAAIASIGLLVEAARAEVRLPNVFGSHMVLQREKPLIIWGWAGANEKVVVKLASASLEAVANERGEWKATLPAMTAGGPYTLKIEGSSSVELVDVMVGEVWLCSGQSNMEMGVRVARDGKAEVAAADHPGLRLLLVPKKVAPVPQPDFDGSWKVCTPRSITEGGWAGFSATAYYFGRELNQKLGVTIGLIESSWGGTRIEPWTPPQGFAAVPALKREWELAQLGDPLSLPHQQRLELTLQEVERWLAESRQALSNRTLVPSMPVFPAELLAPKENWNPTGLYNGMIHPLCPFVLRGAIWYQGESNLGEGMLYKEKMKALVAGWRQLWGLGEFPFFYVQIAPYDYGKNPETEAEFWEAQAQAQTEIPNSGMVTINDIGDIKNIHPANKQEVGRRLALWAMAKTYGKDMTACTGPIYKSMAVEGNHLRVTFDSGAKGLSSRDGQPLSWFEIIDADKGGFVKADAKIDGASVLLSSSSVPHPVAMRFAWSMFAEPNLVNDQGLPASAFRAGTVPNRSLLEMYVPEAEGYQLVYDLDLTKTGSNIQYKVDNHSRITAPFDRIAYYLELKQGDGFTKYAYVSMDAFTTNLSLIGVPTAESGAFFQQEVSNMNVFSNAKGVTTGTGLQGGNIEFWPNNYGPNNSAKVANASSETYDFGDQPSEPEDGYGSMQVHNYAARQTIFALNHWRAGNGADLGIGNQSGNNPDWTFAGNAGSFPARRLKVLVRCK